MAIQSIALARQDTSEEILLMTKALEERVKMIQYMVYDLSKFDWSAFWADSATGEVFSTKFYYYETSTSPKGEKMNASVGLNATPSTETVRGEDTFGDKNAFSYIECNFECIENGTKHVTAIKGDSHFSRTGKVQVGIVTPPTYWAKEDHADEGYYIIHFSDRKDHPEIDAEFIPTPWTVAPDGTELGYGVVTKYYAGLIDGVPYSSSGLPILNFVSHNSARTYLDKLGENYYGSGSERTAYLLCMLWIKYQTKNSQNYFRGCENYNIQVKVAEATEAQTYVVIPTSTANNLVIGSYVSIGDALENTNLDCGASYMRDIADKVMILRTEAIDGTGNSRVYLDTAPITCTETTYLSTMPWGSGACDDVLGHDGYVENNGKCPFVLGGVEDMVGAYYISLNEIWNKETQTTVSYYARKNAAWSNSAAGYEKIATCDMVNTSDVWIGDIDIDLATGIQYLRTEGSGDSVGVGDRMYKGGSGTGLREALQRGNLWGGSYDGLSFAYLWNDLSSVGWYFAVCV